MPLATRPRDVVVLATGRYLPERVFHNREFESFLETSDEWITTRTGISERRLAAPGEQTSDMAVKAGRIACERAGISPSELDLIIVPTVTGDTIFPATANWVQGKLGNTKAWSFDVNAGCSGFVYAMGIATSLLRSGLATKALVIGAEKMSALMDFTDRSSCVLFGDGAAALVLAAVEQEDNPAGYGFSDFYLGSDGTLAPVLYQPDGGSSQPPTPASLARHGHYIHMLGQDVYKHAVRRMDETVTEILASSGLTPPDVDWYIAHQANVRIIESVQQRLGVPRERFYVNIERYGNTTSATIPLCLDELNEQGKLRPGQRIILFTFGAGFTWGSAMLTWGNPYRDVAAGAAAGSGREADL